MISNVETVQLTGRATVWDGTNLAEVQEVAGSDFIGVHTTHVLVRCGESEGNSTWVQQGWTISSFGGRTVVSSPDTAAFLLRELPETEEAGA